MYGDTVDVNEESKRIHHHTQVEIHILNCYLQGKQFVCSIPLAPYKTWLGSQSLKQNIEMKRQCHRHTNNSDSPTHISVAVSLKALANGLFVIFN